MPNIGNEIESLDDLKKDQYAWSRSKEKFKNRQDIILINDDDIFSPWKLVEEVKVLFNKINNH